MSTKLYILTLNCSDRRASFQYTAIYDDETIMRHEYDFFKKMIDVQSCFNGCSDISRFALTDNCRKHCYFYVEDVKLLEYNGNVQHEPIHPCDLYQAANDW